MPEKQKNQYEEKKILRTRMLVYRDALSSEQKSSWDERILNHLIEYDRKNPCAAYLCYVSYKSEVSTKKFIWWCLEKGKAVFLPKVLDLQKTTAEMEFYQIASWEELKEGYQGIPEPKALSARAFSEWLAKKEPKVMTERIPVSMLLPGAVFDMMGNRIGYGGGFYDRWIAKQKNDIRFSDVKLAKIGLAYKLQVVEEIPAERFDQRVDEVITEEGKICLRKMGRE